MASIAVGRNPLSFTQVPVTWVITTCYIVLAVVLLWVHNTLPSLPTSAPAGINMTEAFINLKLLTHSPHPYNSHRNVQVRNWLLERVQGILDDNGAAYQVENSVTPKMDDSGTIQSSRPSLVTAWIFNDVTSNASYSSSSGSESTYFEGTNIIIYIVGARDSDTTWWRNGNAPLPDNSRGVLVNAHYDSVSTGFGATDDGVGVVSILELLRYFTTEGLQPQRGIVLLLNNGEEDYLNGANVFIQHPMSRFVDSFVNLEGAGAGGRAALFRSTDAEVSHAYARSPHPFGTVVSADGFKRRLVRSETDYAVFNGKLGLRGVDIAFFAPRSRYHTLQDSVKYTSSLSIQHMLSAALATTEQLSSIVLDTSTIRDGVWFDLFGKAFLVFDLRTLFAWSVTLLVTLPIAVAAILFIVWKKGKMYIFAHRPKVEGDEVDVTTGIDRRRGKVGGWKGFTRFPIAFVIATGVNAGFALLVNKVNPYIIYSSQWMLWSMFLSSWFVISWFFLKGAAYMRPSALQRAHAFGWIMSLFWMLLVVAAVAQSRFEIAGTYPIVFYYLMASVAALTGYIEFFGLPSIQQYEEASSLQDSAPLALSRVSSGTETSSRSQSKGKQRHDNTDHRHLSERTPLLHHEHASSGSRHVHYELSSTHTPTIPNDDPNPYDEEQAWSTSMPTWVWSIQFLVMLAPIIPVAQIGLFQIDALSQTIADGNSPLTVYMSLAFLAAMIVLPTSPFAHRISTRIPILLALICFITLVYNLTAFPFSSEHRLKVFFKQAVDLDSGINTVSLVGLDEYVERVISELPSASQQPLLCGTPEIASRIELTQCSWSGLAPNVIPQQPLTSESQEVNIADRPSIAYKDWMNVTSTRHDTSNKASIEVSGLNTRACRLRFSQPLTDFNISGSAETPAELVKAPLNGTKEIRLWSREFSRTWRVDIEWKGKIGLDGTALCLWSDAHIEGLIPALDEVHKYQPLWATVSKLDDGLVEGRKSFMV